MDVIKLLNERKDVVMAEVIKRIPEKEPRIHYDMMRDYPLRSGKGLRPTLCMITCQAYGRDEKDALLTAAALEVFQNWILIHDDVEDESDERRGEPCLHKKYGVPLAINAGDALHIKMWELLFENRKTLGDEKAWRVVKEFINMINETTEGQTMELSWVCGNKWDVTEQDYYTMVDKKTSRYTGITPMRLGGIIADAPETDLDRIIEFGTLIGRAFQLQDDVLNLAGEEEKYGKEIAGDLWEGKRTLILIHMLAHCTPEEKKRVLAAMDRKREEKTKKDMDYVLGLMREKGSIGYAKREALGYAQKAKQLFGEFEMPENESKKEIMAIIDFIIQREL